jgi:hypothetical protein
MVRSTAVQTASLPKKRSNDRAKIATTGLVMRLRKASTTPMPDDLAGSRLCKEIKRFHREQFRVADALRLIDSAQVADRVWFASSDPFDNSPNQSYAGTNHVTRLSVVK